MNTGYLLEKESEHYWRELIGREIGICMPRVNDSLLRTQLCSEPVFSIPKRIYLRGSTGGKIAGTAASEKSDERQSYEAILRKPVSIH
jgi:hypothetical protein